MKTVFHTDELSVLLQDFYELTGLRTVVFDAYGIDILSYPKELPDFCKLIRRTENGKLACFQCDQIACKRAKESKKTVMYDCHAGLIEVITPIFVKNAVVGYLLLSHIVQGIDEKAETQLVKNRCKQYGICENELMSAYQKLQKTEYKKIKSASNLLSMAASAIYETKLAKIVSGSVQDKLADYLNNNLSKELTSETICNALEISRTTLFNLSKEMYGLSINKHITNLRMQRAIELLTDSHLSIAQICDEIGINDYNYFFRVFQKHTGFKPSAYKKRSI